MSKFEHASVLLSELVDSLNIQPGSIAVDCTAGGGGHTAKMLELVGPQGRVLAFDRDSWAVKELQRRFKLELEAGQLELIQAPFSQLEAELNQRGLLGRVQALCADIGVSSPQLDQGQRGFSFNKDGPLDMRMDQSQALSAAVVVNTYTAEELLRIFREYGEEPQARPIVRALIKRRESKPFTSTLELADLIASTVHYKERSRKHPATKVFQALRIEVNAELDELQTLLQTLPSVLASQGRAAIISFHSLEDRLIKHAFRKLAEGERGKINRHLPLTAIEVARLESRQFTIVKPFPIVASEDEQAVNPRSRSAKLRVIERLPMEETL